MPQKLAKTYGYKARNQELYQKNPMNVQPN